MTSTAGFSVPEELLKPSAHATTGRRRQRTPLDSARWAVGLLTTSGLLVVDAGAVAFAGIVVLTACLVALVVRPVVRSMPRDLRARASAGIVGSALAGVLAGVILASAIDEAQGRGFVYGTAVIALAGAGLLLADARRSSDRGRGAVDPAPPVAGAALEVRSLDFAYGTQQVLFDVSLTVREGEIAALLGTNGAGKSTILRAVAGLDPPVAGTIRLFGEDTTYRDAEDVLRSGVALLAGGRMIFPSLTVDENLRVGAYTLPRGGTVDEVYQRFPALAARRRQRAGTLSGGEQQMLALGRVLLTKPKLLLIDELTLGLAPKVVEDLIGTVRDLNAQGTTVLLVEQSVNLALTLAAHSFFLERGEVRFDGPTDELLQRDDLLRPVFLADTAT